MSDKEQYSPENVTEIAQLQIQGGSPAHRCAVMDTCGATAVNDYRRLGCYTYLSYKHTLCHKRIHPSWSCYLLLSAHAYAGD